MGEGAGCPSNPAFPPGSLCMLWSHAGSPTQSMDSSPLPCPLPVVTTSLRSRKHKSLVQPACHHLCRSVVPRVANSAKPSCTRAAPWCPPCLAHSTTPSCTRAAPWHPVWLTVPCPAAPPVLTPFHPPTLQPELPCYLKSKYDHVPAPLQTLPEPSTIGQRGW